MDLKKAFPYLGLVVAQLIFAGSSPVLKIFGQENGVNPFMYILYRNVGGALVLFIIALQLHRKIEIPTKRELLVFAILGTLEMAITIYHAYGVYLLSSDASRLFEATAPVWGIAFAVLLKIENIPSIKALDGILKLLGIVLGILGTIIAVLGKLKFKHRLPQKLLLEIVGYSFVISSPMVLALKRVIIKKYLFTLEDSRWKLYPIFVTTWILLFTAAGSLLLSLFYVNHPETFLSIKGSAIIPLIYFLLLNNVVALTVVNWCAIHLSASTVTAFRPLQTTFCVFLSYIFIGEVLTVLQIIGSVTICIALFVTIFSNYEKEKQQNKTNQARIN